MKCLVWDCNGKVVSEMKLPEALSSAVVRKDIMHDVVRYQLDKRRSGTHQTKTEGVVSGSTRKIYQQKGTGRARHGIIRAAQFRGGGVIFGPQPRSYAHKVNKKVRLLGLCSALSHKISEGSFMLFNNFEFESCKTARFVSLMNMCNVKSAAVIDSACNVNLKKALCNVHTFVYLPVLGLNVYDILRHEKIIFTLAALDELMETRLKELCSRKVG